MRVSQQMRVRWPLSANGRLAVVASNHVFLQVNTPAGATRGLDNWAFAGVDRTLARRARVEAGYLNLYTRGSNGRASSHIMSIALVVSR